MVTDWKVVPMEKTWHCTKCDRTGGNLGRTTTLSLDVRYCPYCDDHTKQIAKWGV